MGVTRYQAKEQEQSGRRSPTGRLTRLLVAVGCSLLVFLTACSSAKSSVARPYPPTPSSATATPPAVPTVEPSSTPSNLELFSQEVENYGGVQIGRSVEAAPGPTTGIMPWPGGRPAAGYLLYVAKPLVSKTDVAQLLVGLHQAMKLDRPPQYHGGLGNFSIAVEDPSGVRLVADAVDLTINRSAAWWINTGLYWFKNGKPMKRPDMSTLAATSGPAPVGTKSVGDCTIKANQDPLFVVEYKVTGAGTSSSNVVTFFNLNGDEAQDTQVSLPWHYCMFDRWGSGPYILSAQNNQGSGSITCSVLEGGDVFDKNTANGGYSICQAQG